MREYVNKRKGFYKAEINHWHRARFMAYYAAGPYLKKGTKITDILRLPDDKKRGKSLKDLNGDELKKWYEQRKELERKAGIRTDNEQ